MEIKTLFFLNIVFLPHLTADIFASMYKMRNLIETEKQIIKSLEDYIKMEKNRSKGFAIIHKYLKRTKEEHEIAEKDVEHYVGNPINAYTLIKRQTIELDYVEKLIGNSTTYKRNDSVQYPTTEDLEGAIVGLNRIQKVYQLNVTQLANGTLMGMYSRNRTLFVEYVFRLAIKLAEVDFHELLPLCKQLRQANFYKFYIVVTACGSQLLTPMSYSDCFELGRANHSDKNYMRNVPWLLTALRKYNTSDNDASNVTDYDILYQIAFTHIVMGDLDASKWINELYNKFQELKFPDIQMRHILMLQEIRSMEDNEIDHIKNVTESKRFPQVEDYGTVSSACRGERNGMNNSIRSLTCEYANKFHPYLAMVRMKTEYLSLEPSIMLIYDFISDTEIQVLQRLAMPQITRSGVVYYIQGERNTRLTPSRISQGAWLYEYSNYSEIIEKLSRRIELFTGLSMKYADRFYVNNYGIGGHYLCHYDYFAKREIDTYNRVATFLLYLSEVEQGGATVFPVLDLSVFPIKGAALFWINLLSTGEGNRNTLHAACPVMRGNKWVANKFINLSGQNLTNPLVIPGGK